jgi:hypothetical protein
MHLEAMIVRNWMPKLSELGDTLGGCDQGSLEAVIE